MYSLILTLMMYGAYGRESAVSIHHVDGFKSEAGCLAAGNAWIAQQKAKQYTYQRLTVNAMCVKQ